MPITSIPPVPNPVRVITFFDGQNFFNQAKRAFNSSWPDYDPIKLSEFYISRYPNNNLVQVRFYTGVPLYSKDSNKNLFWRAKLAQHSKDPRFIPITRYLSYHDEEIVVEDPTTGQAIRRVVEIPREKGIDVRIALDLLQLAFKDFDVGVIFSQDKDLLEAVNDLVKIRNTGGQWLRIDTAFCYDPALPRHFRIGLQNTTWFRFDRAAYTACKDPNDYRPKTPPPGSLFSP